MAYETNDKKIESVYSKRIKAGKRRTYFFDVRATRGNDYYLTITESRKRFTDDGYDRHKIFLYKEDFNKFIKGLNEAAEYVKTELMPDFDFDAFNHENDGEYEQNNGYVNNNTEVEVVENNNEPVIETIVEATVSNNNEEAETLATAIVETAEPVAELNNTEEVDKW